MKTTKPNADKMTAIWMVTRPKTSSALGDICFKTEVNKLGLQFLGGLRPDDLLSFHATEAGAMAEAREQLSQIGKRLLEQAAK